MGRRTGVARERESDRQSATARERASTRGSAKARALIALPGDAARAASIPAELDRLIHERIRLGIVSALAVNDALSFGDLKALMNTTDGNLSVHARKLEEAEYVSCRKSFAGRTPRTEYRLSRKGREALEHYLAHMEALIQATREG